jgi:ribosomal protein S27AE
MTKIIRNIARCSKCGDVIESKHVHDYVSCKCGAIAVDGGREYLKRGFHSSTDIIELSVTEEPIPDF